MSIFLIHLTIVYVFVFAIIFSDLTEKGLKKLANSVDLSYSTVESLITKQLQSSGVNMFYFLNSLKGLSRITHFFEVLVCFI